MTTRSKAIDVLLDGPALGFGAVGGLPCRILKVVEERADTFNWMSEHGKKPSGKVGLKHLDSLHKVCMEEYHVGQATLSKAQTAGTGKIRERRGIDIDELSSRPRLKDIERIVGSGISHIPPYS